MVQHLVRNINVYGSLVDVPLSAFARHADLTFEFHRNIRAAVPHAKKMHDWLGSAFASFDGVRDDIEVDELLQQFTPLMEAVAAFLKDYVPKKAGRPGRNPMVEIYVDKWAPAVRDCLLAAGWPAVAISGDNSPALGVVSKMIERVCGQKVPVNTIARLRRQRENRGNNPEEFSPS